MEGRRSVIAIVAFCALSLMSVAPAGAADPGSDAYIAGYAAAVLERELKLSARSLRVDRGVVSLDAADIAGLDPARVTAALGSVRGVTRVDIRTPEAPPVAALAPAPMPETSPGPAREDLHTGFLPGGVLFKPLIADPRWPHFAAAYHRYLDDRDLRDVGAVSFGETITLYRDRIGEAWWEAGIQAGLFAVFDLNAPSTDLVNADYLAAAVLGYRYDRFSALARAFHQSSHLGDEFLLRNRVERVNLSFESVDLRLSYELFGDVLRLYGGGGYLVRRDPESLEPGSLQWGVEFRSPWPGPGSWYRPIAAADVQNREENDWHMDISLRAGVELPGVVGDRRLQLLLEYFRGHSPNGQFYKEKIDYFGVGAHLHF